MTHVSRVSFLSAVTAVFISSFSSSAFAQFTSHRVVYDLDLDTVSAAAQVETIDGQTHYSLERVCDGWETIEDYAISFGFGQNAVSNFISHYQTWESFEGGTFTFAVTENSTLDGDNQYEGYANISDSDAEAYYSNSENGIRELPEDTLFPTSHLRHLLGLARQGVRVSQSHLFLGGEEDGSLYFVNSVMGQRKTVKPDKTLGDLAEDGYWPINIAYYDPESVTPEPEYEISFQVQDNGVIRAYTVKYSDFSMKATLQSSELIKERQC